MAVTHTFAPRREQCFQQIDTLINSHSLRGSESLCKLLRYLAEHSLDHPGVAPKEYQIATEVFGRPAGFDPQSDSTVRVQVGRLRIKLNEYYAQDGLNDAVLVELPKGTYALTFHFRPGKINEPKIAPKESPPPGVLAEKSSGSSLASTYIIVLAVLLLASLVTIGVLISQRTKTQISSASSIPAAYEIFWNHFMSSPQPPWVIFSNGNFVGRPETGMRYFNPRTDRSAFILDHYTGVGEVLAIHQLDQVFGKFNRPVGIKRGALFTLDDAKNNDLIFVGSPSENLTLLDIPGMREFVFQRLASGPRKGDLAIVNVHPASGEPSTFIASPANQPTIEDYAVVTLLPGLDPSRYILILAGNSTFGTQAAVEYVCREDSLKELLQRLHVSNASDLKPFEAVVHVKIAHGVPVTTELVAIRTRRD